MFGCQGVVRELSIACHFFESCGVTGSVRAARGAEFFPTLSWEQHPRNELLAAVYIALAVPRRNRSVRPPFSWTAQTHHAAPRMPPEFPPPPHRDAPPLRTPVPPDAPAALLRLQPAPQE